MPLRHLVDAEFLAHRLARRFAHLAALANVRSSIGHARDYAEINFNGSLNLLEAAYRQLDGVWAPVLRNSSNATLHGVVDFVFRVRDLPKADENMFSIPQEWAMLHKVRELFLQ